MTISRALEETVGGGVTVKAPKTAAGRREMSLPQVVIEALRAHRLRQLEFRLACGLGRPDDDALVFPHPIEGTHQGPRAFSIRWGKAAAKLGVPQLTWHSLRHSHASMLIASGVAISVVSARLGHVNARVTLGVYSHLFSKDDRAAADAIDRALGQ